MCDLVTSYPVNEKRYNKKCEIEKSFSQSEEIFTHRELEILLYPTNIPLFLMIMYVGYITVGLKEN